MKIIITSFWLFLNVLTYSNGLASPFGISFSGSAGGSAGGSTGGFSNFKIPKVLNLPCGLTVPLTPSNIRELKLPTLKCLCDFKLKSGGLKVGQTSLIPGFDFSLLNCNNTTRKPNSLHSSSSPFGMSASGSARGFSNFKIPKVLNLPCGLTVPLTPSNIRELKLPTLKCLCDFKIKSGGLKIGQTSLIPGFDFSLLNCKNTTSRKLYTYDLLLEPIVMFMINSSWRNEIIHRNTKNETLEYLKTMEGSENSLQFTRGVMMGYSVGYLFTTKHTGLKSICNETLKEYSFAYNYLKIVKHFFMGDKDCPIKKGTQVIIPKKTSMTLTFDKQLKCDETVYVDFWFDTSATDNMTAGGGQLTFKVPDNSDCTKEKTKNASSGLKTYDVIIKNEWIMLANSTWRKMTDPGPGKNKTVQYLKTMEGSKNCMQFHSGSLIMYGKGYLFEAKPSGLKSICDETQKKNSYGYNFLKIVKHFLMGGKDCPIEKGTKVLVPKKSPLTLTFDKQLKCNGTIVADFYLLSTATDSNYAGGGQLSFQVPPDSDCYTTSSK